MKKSIFVMLALLLAFGANSFCKERTKKETPRQESGLTWKDLKPMEHYSLYQFMQILDNTPDLEAASVRVGAFYLCMRKPKTEPSFKIKKHSADSVRLLFTLELRDENNAYLLDSVCVDTCKRNFAEMLITTEKGAALQVQDENGNHYLLLSEVAVENICIADIGDKQVSAGAFDASFWTLIDDADFYFWDKHTKSLWCYILEENRIVDLYNSLDEAVFFYPDDEVTGFGGTKILFVKENNKKSPRFGAVWQCQNHNLVRIK